MDGLRPRLIHAAIGPVSLIFCRDSLRFFFFCFPQTHFEPYHPLKSPITLHLLSHPPSFRSEAVTVALHLRSKTLASPSISDPKPLPHPPSPISTVTLHLFDLNPRLTLHLRSPPTPSTSTTTTALRPILGFGLCFETHLALSILLALPKTPSNSVTNCESFFLLLFLKLVWLFGCCWFFFFFN